VLVCAVQQRSERRASTQKRLFATALGTLLVTPILAQAQEPPAAPIGAPSYELPLAPSRPFGLAVAPFLEGWLENADGTYTFSFGYFNLNTEEVVEIPVGPDNFVEPSEYDGTQPTVFRPRRDRGVYAVTVPGDFAERGGRVTWTLRHRGETLTAAGHIGSVAYQLNFGPQAMGSMPPKLGFVAEGPRGQSIAGITGEPRTANVGVPLPLSVWVAPDDELGTPLRVSFFKHQGPVGGRVFFETDAIRTEALGGEVSTYATFTEPGTYVLRVRADNWAAVDSGSGAQCCWTNGYLPVTVIP
jgi:hypothetical protein